MKLNIKKPGLKKLKWGIAGLGRYAENTFIPTVSQLRRSTVIAVYSRSAERAKSVSEKYAINNYFTDYDEFLKSPIEAVYIGSANVFHYEQVIKAAKAGKHILCDKPLAITSAQAEEMVRACKDNNVKLAVNYTYRFHPLISKAKEFLNAGMLGQLVSINVNFNIDFPPGPNFRFIKEQSGGGALRDLGTHMIDLLRFFGGEIVSIQGVVDNLIYKSEVDDFAAAIARYKDGGYAIFNVSFNSKRAFNRIDILGNKGAISIEKLIAAKNAPSKLTILLEGEGKKAFQKRGNKLLYLLKSVQKSFLRNETPLVTGEDGLENMKLMEELERNALPD